MDRVFVLPAQRSVQAKAGYFGSKYDPKPQVGAARGAMVVPGALMLRPPSVEVLRGRPVPPCRADRLILRATLGLAVHCL